MSVISSQSSSSELEHVLPHNLEAERSVLGCCLLDRAAFLAILARLRPDDFFHPPHKIIFEAIKKLFTANVSPDYISVTNALIEANELSAAGGAEYIAGLTTVVPSVRSAEHYADIVYENAQLRRLHRLGNEMSRFVTTRRMNLREIVNWSSNEFLNVLNLRENKSYSHIGSIASDFMTEYDANYDDKTPSGIPSGFPDLDKMLLGFQPGNLIILAARPSQGKTALALDMARLVASRGSKVAFCSLEMSERELLMRLLCSAGKLDSYKLRQKRLSDKKDNSGKNDWDRLKESMAALDKMSIFIDDTSALTISELTAKIKGIKMEQKGLDLVIIDYLQLLDGELGMGDMRVQEVSKISRMLKALARDVDAPVVALSQLSRNIERREGHKRVPQLSDLRESGSIEQDADVVLFIHREITESDEEEGRVYEPDDEQETQLIVAKNRNGAVGKVFLLFLRKYATFVQLDQPPVTYRNI
jgi:replicative DNA helicase